MQLPRRPLNNPEAKVDVLWLWLWWQRQLAWIFAIAAGSSSGAQSYATQKVAVFVAAKSLEASEAHEPMRLWALKHGCAAVRVETATETVVVPPLASDTISETIDVIALTMLERVAPRSLSG